MVQVAVTSDSNEAADIGKGEVAVKPGSGTIKIEDAVAQINTREEVTITYTADTSIANAYLVVQIPDGAFKMPDAHGGDDTNFIDLTLTDANYPPAALITDDDATTEVDEGAIHPNGATAGNRYGRVTKSGASSIVQRLFESSTPNTDTNYPDYDTIVWGPISLSSGKTFVGKISNVRITDEVEEYAWDADLLIGP